jgi:hypothetical protein
MKYVIAARDAAQRHRAGIVTVERIRTGLMNTPQKLEI